MHSNSQKKAINSRIRKVRNAVSFPEKTGKTNILESLICTFVFSYVPQKKKEISPKFRNGNPKFQDKKGFNIH